MSTFEYKLNGDAIEALKIEQVQRGEPVAWMAVSANRIPQFVLEEHIANLSFTEPEWTIKPVYTNPKPESKCPYIVTGGDGTSHCRLAESQARVPEGYVLVPVDTLNKAAAYLHQAAEDVQDWGDYAPEYSRKKYGLAFDIKLYKDRAAEFEALLSASQSDKEE